MAVDLTKQFIPYVDELFKEESRLSLLTNTDFDFSGAHSVVLWRVSTVPLNDYCRDGSQMPENTFSRYGAINDLNTQTQECLLSRDRSFIFNIDKLDQDETKQQLEGGKALARELREIVVPEVDSYTYAKMVEGAGTKVTKELTADNIYGCIIEGTKILDDAEVPETERVLVLTPTSYATLKMSNVFDSTNISDELKVKGVVAVLDGMNVIKVPASRLPENFGFMIAHPSATVAPVKLDDYGLHVDTPLSSGTIVTGRIVYDSFVLTNKQKAIYYHAIA